MRNFFKISLVAGLCFSFSVTAQESRIYTHANKDYQEALNLYNNKQYQAAQSVFSKVKEQTSDYETEANCAYYIANAAIRLNQLGADKLMEDFVEYYPTSTRRNSAFIDVADYYFEHGKYAYALKWYDKVEDQNMSNREREGFNFKKGYALFTARKYKDAERYFNQVETSQEYGSQAKYYIGYMAYQRDNYDRASAYFDKISNEEEFNEKLSYYQADLNFKLGNFQKAIDLAKAQLPKSDRKEISELNKIIGESYFNLKEYEAAIPYLRKYKGKRGRWNNTDFYQLGYAYYKQKDYENAIGQFNKIVGGKNKVAQNAYYHLAECYLNTDKKQQALNAFRNASQMNFDEQIQKDAWLNYARLSYDIGNPYQSVPEVLTSYLEKYPDSGYKAEIEELLVDSYITSKNYEAALEVLDKNKSFTSKEAYQKVAFYRGLELYTEGDYQEAVEFLDKSLKEPQEPTYTARAIYWKAESDYLLNNFDEALIGYKQFAQNSVAQETDEYQTLNYNLAYTYFKQKDYPQAIEYFTSYINKSKDDEVRLNDSYLRLGDSHFVSAKYWPAIEAYNKSIALNGNDVDYASFQKAISYGFVNRNERKIEELNKFISAHRRSPLRDDAMYELGNSYVNDNRTAEGLDAYDQLISNYRRSSYVSKALLKQGLIHYNAGSNNLALAKFKTVVRDFPNTQEALQAVSTAKLIYVDTGRVDEYAAWVKDLDFVDVSDAELDNDSFESAERQYAQNKTDAAIRAFESYLKQFPNGLHALKAHFYLAQSYFSKDQKENSLDHYIYVTSKERNEYTEQALVRLSEIYLGQKSYRNAITVLKRLEQEADFPQNITFAQSNIMKASYELRNYPETVTYAEKVLGTAKIDNRIKSDAQVMIARSAIQTGDEDRAKAAYAEVRKIATGSLAAEALYYDAYFKNKEGDHEGSNASVQKLANDYSAYKEFGAKGLIIMAKNFYALDDAFQATYILENVTQNFTDYPEIVEEAKKELNTIKTEESKRNSSVDPDNNN
ncbi:tetratricopeptide repeat protein [Leptobacterium flavescens]|uniref:Tetratricopeptide repeat protein n=1 Tax=Leptobacterium flavescens TaxID=472055 RepID=A0A6P0URY0_9FLAO|nr:tetratricopeptide repeat protein [Leptobacterium flavescens]NER15292.1 tetratricopeptide repeat protein [Leptobacterium flavescens]